MLCCAQVNGTSTVAASDTFNVVLDVTNRGSMDGKIVVQVYFSQVGAI